MTLAAMLRDAAVADREAGIDTTPGVAVPLIVTTVHPGYDPMEHDEVCTADWRSPAALAVALIRDYAAPENWDDDTILRVTTVALGVNEIRISVIFIDHNTGRLAVSWINALPEGQQ